MQELEKKEISCNDFYEKDSIRNESNIYSTQYLKILIKEVDEFIIFSLIHSYQIQPEIVSNSKALIEKPIPDFTKDDIRELFSVRNYLLKTLSPVKKAFVTQELLRYETEGIGFQPAVLPAFSRANRQIIIVLFVSSVIALGLSLTSYINASTVQSSVFALTGLVGLAKMFLILSFSSIGSIFSILSNSGSVNFAHQNTDDNLVLTENLHWHQYVLGLISGFVMSEFAGQTYIIPNSIDAVSNGSFFQITLAVFGGFSAYTIYSILIIIQDRLISSARYFFESPSNLNK